MEVRPPASIDVQSPQCERSPPPWKLRTQPLRYAPDLEPERETSIAWSCSEPMSKEMFVENMQVVHASSFVAITAAEQQGFDAALAADATVAVAPRLIVEGAAIYIALLAEHSLLTSIAVIHTPVEGLHIGKAMIKGFLDAQLARNVLANGLPRRCIKMKRRHLGETA